MQSNGRPDANAAFGADRHLLGQQQADPAEEDTQTAHQENHENDPASRGGAADELGFFLRSAMRAAEPRPARAPASIQATGRGRRSEGGRSVAHDGEDRDNALDGDRYAGLAIGAFEPATSGGIGCRNSRFTAGAGGMDRHGENLWGICFPPIIADRGSPRN